jgi:formylglycine-generating enzyme required for sulfatase activity
VVFVLASASGSALAELDLKVDIGCPGQEAAGNLKAGWVAFDGTACSGAVSPVTVTNIGGSGIDVGITVGNTSDNAYRSPGDYTGDEMGRDYVSADNSISQAECTMTVTLHNLPEARYTLTTYHNCPDYYATMATMDITVSGSGVVGAPTNASGVAQTVLSQNVLFDEIGKGTVEFVADGIGEVVVTFVPREQAHKWRVYLNGFELIGADLRPTIRFDSAASGNLEPVSPAELTVTLSWPEEGQTYTVDYAATGGTATAGEDYTMSGGTGPACWNYATQCHGDCDNDANVKGSDFLVLKDSWYQCDPDLNYNPCADFDRDGCVKGSDFLVLKSNWYQTVEANCPSSGGGSTLVFNPGETSRTISIEIIDDGLDEEDETIVVELLNPTGPNVVLGEPNRHTYTIIDPRPKVSFDTETSGAPEDAGSVDIPVILSHSWGDTVTVDFMVSGGTATPDVDYTLADGTLTFDPGVTTQNITIAIVDDLIEESSETILLTLSNPVQGELGQDPQHTYRIFDNELGPTFTNSIGMEFVQLVPGTFMMGSYSGDRDEKPVHQVTITSSFHMSVTEVTNAQYEQFDPAHGTYRAPQTYNGQTVHMSTGDNEAVIYVSWEDANNFCRWLSNLEGRPYRLPTEAEWEYACRAGTTSPYYTGDSLPPSYYKNQENSSWPTNVDLTVKTTGQNTWGLWDMHGNVEEWCYDWYGPYESGSQTDPVGRVNGRFRVSRGGSHNTPVFYLRSANRLSSLPEDKQWSIGFRVACGEMPNTPALPEPAPKTWATGVSQTKYVWPSEHETPTPYFTGPEVWVRQPAWASEIPMYGHNHQPAVTFCDNGDLLGAWYSCESERGRELTVLASRLRQGNSTWDYPDEFFRAQDRNMHGTALFNDRKGKLYLFNGLGTDYSWAKLALCTATSTDNGVTWQARIINPHHGKHHQVIAGPIRTREGYIIVAGDANPGSAVHISRDDGQTFVDPGANRPVPSFTDGGTGAWIAGIHCGFVQLLNGDLIAFGRGDNIDDMMPKSVSSDMGDNWTYSASPFQPIGGGQRCVLLRLEYSYGERLGGTVDSPIFLLSFGSGTMLNGEHQLEGCSGMFGTVSYDEGQTWTTKKLISNLQGSDYLYLDAGGNTGDFTMTRTQGEPKGYLSATQSPDGVIHVCSSRLYYAFNLVWIDPVFTPEPVSRKADL